jgi:DNA repair protein RadC
MKMSDRLRSDRPREKLAQKGADALSDYELMMAIIGSGNAQADVTKIARDTRKLIAEKASGLTYEDLLTIKSLGPAKATQIMAGFELWRRQFEVSERPIIDSLEKAAEQVSDICDKKQEYFVCLTLDGASRLISRRTISVGTLSASLVHPREVFADAITDRAAGVIVAHNHPSGLLKATGADIETTERLKQSAVLLGIHFVDHIIVTKSGFTSVESEGDKHR